MGPQQRCLPRRAQRARELDDLLAVQLPHRVHRDGHQRPGLDRAKHVVPNWIPCPDGTFASGLQVFRFIRATPDGASTDPTSNTLVGEDITTGPTGACGRSLPLYITMPFKLAELN